MDKPYALYIIDNSGNCLFSHDFKSDIESLDPVLFSGFLTAIMHFSTRLNTQLASKETTPPGSTLSTISFNLNIEFIIEYVKTLTGAMIIDKTANIIESRAFLKQVLNAFNTRYSELLKHWDHDTEIFEGFKFELERIFGKGQIYSYQIPRLLKAIPSYLKDLAEPLEPYIDGLRSIQELAHLSSLSIEEVKQRISKLWWYDYIDLSQGVSIDDIYEPRKELFYLLRTKPSVKASKEMRTSTPEYFEILRRINGFMTVNELKQELKDTSIEHIQKTISYYLSQGAYLRKVQLFPQIIQITQDFKMGFPADVLPLIFTLENICDGDLSLEHIAVKTRVPITVIKAVLNQLGDAVTYRKEYEF